MTDHAVEFHSVSKVYRVYDRPVDRLLERFTGRPRHSEVTALSNVSFAIPRGTTFGIVGRNGSGKSTALQIMASVLQPTSGSTSVKGRVSALLELGSGFNPDFTGLENVYLYASILGLSRKEIDDRLEAILVFADIGEFVHRPVKTYSSGMVVRLAFAVAVSIDPDVLIVDEALSVGDALFQHKCILRMRKIIESGTTVIFVSHDIATVKLLCQNALLLEHGKVVALGDAETVAQEYHRRLFHDEVNRDIAPQGSDFVVGENPKASSATVSREAPPIVWPGPDECAGNEREWEDRRFGTGEARIVAVHLFDEQGERTLYADYGAWLTIRLYIRFHQGVSSAVAGIVIRNAKGLDVLATNTHIEHVAVQNIAQGEVIAVDFSMSNLLRDDHYSISPAVTHQEYFHQPRPYDWIDNALVFRAGKPKSTIVYGVFYPTDVAVVVNRNSESEQVRTRDEVHAEAAVARGAA